MVFGVAGRLLGDTSDAEEVSQTVFLRAFERFETLGNSPSAGGWLRTVTTNLCLSHLARSEPAGGCSVRVGPMRGEPIGAMKTCLCLPDPKLRTWSAPRRMGVWSRGFDNYLRINAFPSFYSTWSSAVTATSPPCWTSPWRRSKQTFIVAGRPSES